MQKPKVSSIYKIELVFDSESKIQFVDVNKGKSFQTITFPKDTQVIVMVSKKPISVEE